MQGGQHRLKCARANRCKRRCGFLTRTRQRVVAMARPAPAADHAIDGGAVGERPHQWCDGIGCAIAELAQSARRTRSRRRVCRGEIADQLLRRTQFEPLGGVERAAAFGEWNVVNNAQRNSGPWTTIRNLLDSPDAGVGSDSGWGLDWGSDLGSDSGSDSD